MVEVFLLFFLSLVLGDDDSQRRIVGGLVVTPEEYAENFNHYVGILDLRKRGGTWDQFGCSGVLITNKHVLTAGHCADNDGDKDVLGGTHLLSDDVAGEGHRIHVKKIFRHPDFVRKELWHDIAVFELEEEVTPDMNMRPMKRASADDPVLHTDDEMTVVGWGDTDPSDVNAYPYTLMWTTVPSLDDAECDTKLRNGGYGALDHSEKHCAGGEFRDTCQGDSGGPLWRNGRLYGLVSWGASCHGHLPAVYTDVIAYEKFIDAAIAGIEWPKGSGIDGPDGGDSKARSLSDGEPDNSSSGLNDLPSWAIVLIITSLVVLVGLLGFFVFRMDKVINEDQRYCCLCCGGKKEVTMEKEQMSGV